MAIIQYNSGVVEEVKPIKMVFGDKELLNFFEDHKKLRTKRLIEVPNSWCIWGEKENKDPNQFNQLATRVTMEKIYSPLMIVHDSELDPDKDLTDRIILKPYPIFKEEVLLLFDSIANEITSENIQNSESNSEFSGSPVPPNLDIIGPTEDRRVLLEYNPDNQGKKFYEFNNFSVFTSRTFGYLHQFFNKNTAVPNNSFAIFADNKSIIIVMDDKVDTYMEMLLDNFEKREKYHGCSHIIAILKKWGDYIKGNKDSMDKPWEDYIRKSKKDGKG